MFSKCHPELNPFAAHSWRQSIFNFELHLKSFDPFQNAFLSGMRLKNIMDPSINNTMYVICFAPLKPNQSSS